MSVRWPDNDDAVSGSAWSSTATVMVIGNDRLFADAVSITLEGAGIRVMSVLEPSEHAVAVVEGDGPDVVLIEVDASGAGLSIGGRVARTCGGSTKVVALSQADDPRLIERAVRMGFSGFLTKGLPTAEFVRSIERIADGHVVVPEGSAEAEEPWREGRLALLTRREREVLTLLVRGATSDQIANELSVSDHTVRTHMQNIFAKLDVRSRVQAAAIAVKHGVR